MQHGKRAVGSHFENRSEVESTTELCASVEAVVGASYQRRARKHPVGPAEPPGYGIPCTEEVVKDCDGAIGRGLEDRAVRRPRPAPIGRPVQSPIVSNG